MCESKDARRALIDSIWKTFCSGDLVYAPASFVATPATVNLVQDLLEEIVSLIVD